MWRALVFIGLLAVAAFAAVWLADRPGNVVVTWGGYQAQTSVAVALIATVGIAFGLSLLWTAVRFLTHLPSRMSYASRARRRARGYQAVSRGMVAVGAGDPLAARRHASEAERLLGREPLTLLLKAQAAQVSGDRPAAEAAFRRLVDEGETRVLGLRGLFVEARRRGDMAAARGYAMEAARLAPAATWANEAVLEAQCAEGDWRGAIATIERRGSLGLVDRSAARRQRAVLLTADAQADAERDPEGALASVLDAVKLAPDLVPAAALAGRLLSRRGDLRRAAKIVETAWKAQPHPDLAAVYLNLRPGDSAQDRLRRAETLAKLSAWHPEARLAVASAALDARDFSRARSAIEPLLAERPTMRTCLFMADLEQAEHGATGKAREWIARAARAPRDPAWIADGIVSDRWAPISPVTGRLDAFVWQAPPDVLAAPEPSLLDEVLADLDDKAEAHALAAPSSETPARMAVAAESSAVERGEAVSPKPGLSTVPAASAEAADQEVRHETSAPETAAAAATPGTLDPAKADLPKADLLKSGAMPDLARSEAAMPRPSKPGATPLEPTRTPEATRTEALESDLAKSEGRPDGPVPEREPKPVKFPVEHAPDDPGPDGETARPQRFRLFG